MKMKRKNLLFLPIAGLLMATLASCGGSDELQLDYEDNGEEYEIVYYMPYNDSSLPTSYEAVARRASVILKEKINSTLKIVPVLYGEYTNKMNALIAAAVDFDVCFTAPEINPYGYNVNKEAFVPLDHLLPKYAPQTWAGIDLKIWDQIKIDGHIYGSINEQIFPRTLGVKANSSVLLKEFLDKNYDGIAPSEVYQHISNPYNFIEEYLNWLKLNDKGNGGKISEVHTESYLMNYAGFDDLCSGMNVPGAVKISDDQFKVVNQFESQEYKDLINLAAKWKKAGFLKESSQYDITPDSTWKPGYLSNQMIRLSDAHYYTSYVCGTMNAISSTSKNPARAMKFIELLRTDVELHNLLQFGKENDHYLVDPSQPNRIAEFISGSGYNNENFGWGLGTEFISYLIPGQEDDQWEKVKEINKNTEMSPLIGFRFDDTDVYNEVCNCRNVVNKYIDMFAKADYLDGEKDKYYNDFIKELNDNGMNRVLEAKQSQLNEFLSK